MLQLPFLNKVTTLSANQNKSIYVYTSRFYLKHYLWLTLAGLLFFWLSRYDGWDWAISRHFYDPALRRFPWQNNRWLDLINHRLLKDAVLVFGVALLAAAAFTRRWQWLLVALLIGIGPLVVGVLKATSAHSCPWDLLAFGGRARAWPLLGSPPADSGPGHCFPGGHASSGFGLMALRFLFPQPRRLGVFLWAAAVLLGLIMGWGQVMRGAHFVSHNLWAGWWVWLSQLSIYAGLSRWIARRSTTHDGSPKPETVPLD
ncbi:phosphatase PAP2 family protein [Pantoea sp. 1.19]|uniref:phosphatase PAP2 family protein n=1 Tax=Pantoea sp. 1.19 TaxID=1925589 RepID=UPI0009490E29|nr:phosphatase PAP2 family protein [Pantoea sp. 1.19]